MEAELNIANILKNNPSGTKLYADAFGEVMSCGNYVSKANYKYPPHRRGYIIPYNFPLNTRRGFKTIYYLMRLSQHDMTTVIIDIIKVRHESINVILNACDKIEKENDKIIKFLYGGAE